MVQGHARDSIAVDYSHTFGKDAQITVRTKGRWGKRISALSRDKTYPRRSGFYTIPVSWKARKHASNGGGSRSMNLHIKQVTYKGRVSLALVTKARAKGGGHKQGSMRSRNPFGVHYLLVKQWKRKARKGLIDAFEEDRRLLTDVLGGTLL
jgi:hypothetical protein